MQGADDNHEAVFEGQNLGEPVLTEDGSYTFYLSEIEECYHSVSGAKQEATHLYIGASEVSRVFAERTSGIVSILDVGLGLGYNALATIEAWIQNSAGVGLELTSLEYNLGLVLALQSGEAPWQKNWRPDELGICRLLTRDISARRNTDGSDPDGLPNYAPTLSSGSSAADSANYADVDGSVYSRPFNPLDSEIASTLWRAEIPHPSNNSTCVWSIFIADASVALIPRPAQRCDFTAIDSDRGSGWDYVWQDPFSPKKNPEMWSVDWFRKLHSVCHHETKLLTYSCSRIVKNALDEGGWEWQLIKATGKKRQWLYASLWR